jgi:hypothetical protein
MAITTPVSLKAVQQEITGNQDGDYSLTQALTASGKSIPGGLIEFVGYSATTTTTPAPKIATDVYVNSSNNSDLCDEISTYELVYTDDGTLFDGANIYANSNGDSLFILGVNFIKKLGENTIYAFNGSVVGASQGECTPTPPITWYSHTVSYDEFGGEFACNNTPSFGIETNSDTYQFSTLLRYGENQAPANGYFSDGSFVLEVVDGSVVSVTDCSSYTTTTTTSTTTTSLISVVVFVASAPNSDLCDELEDNDYGTGVFKYTLYTDDGSISNGKILYSDSSGTAWSNPGVTYIKMDNDNIIWKLSSNTVGSFHSFC